MSAKSRNTTYPASFFSRLQHGARRSAETIVPLVLELFPVESVLDVGCGTGVWLSVFMQHGVRDVVGVDGDYIDGEMLEIPATHFIASDLNNPLDLERRFDLVISLEVAEHLPPEAAERFVQSLTRHAPAVLFSAAIPHQGGKNHLNEQWPDYWVQIFENNHYAMVDCIRSRIWVDPKIEYWYAQNILMFVRHDRLRNYPAISKELDLLHSRPLAVVHPRTYLELTRARQEQDRILWSCRTELANLDIGKALPPGATFILVDDGTFQLQPSNKHVAVRILERNGQYNGLPATDTIAISEVAHLVGLGTGYLVLTWMAFWWREYYSEFNQYLLSHSRCVLNNERVSIYRFALG